MELDKFLKLDWVLDCQPESATFARSQEVTLKALNLMHEYLLDGHVFGKKRPKSMQDLIAKSLSDFALNAKQLTPDVRDRLIYVMAEVERSTPIPNVGDAIGRWGGQGNEPPGHSYFSYLSRILDLPAESDRRPPLDSVLSSVDQCVESYGKSGYKSNVDRIDIERTREYLLALGEVARAEKNPQLEDLAAREAERLRVVLTEKRDPIRR